MATFSQKVQGLLGDPLFNLGVGILGSNQGHYGAAGPAIFGGVQHAQAQQSAAAQQQMERAKFAMEQAKQEAAIKDALRKEQQERERAAALQQVLQGGLLDVPPEMQAYLQHNPEAAAGLLEATYKPAPQRTPQYFEDPEAFKQKLDLERQIADAKGQAKAKYRAPPQAPQAPQLPDYSAMTPEQQAFFSQPHMVDGKPVFPKAPEAPKAPAPVVPRSASKADVEYATGKLEREERWNVEPHHGAEVAADALALQKRDGGSFHAAVDKVIQHIKDRESQPKQPKQGGLETKTIGGVKYIKTPQGWAVE